MFANNCWFNEVIQMLVNSSLLSVVFETLDIFQEFLESVCHIPELINIMCAVTAGENVNKAEYQKLYQNMCVLLKMK